MTDIKTLDYFPEARVLNWNYRFHYKEFYNDQLKCNCVYFDFWFAGINWDIKQNKKFGFQNIYYDGHQVKSICLFGVMFSLGYTYVFNQMK